MKNIIIAIAIISFFTSCKKSYQCTITTTTQPESTPTTHKFWSKKEKDNWVNENTIKTQNGGVIQFAECH